MMDDTETYQYFFDTWCQEDYYQYYDYDDDVDYDEQSLSNSETPIQVIYIFNSSFTVKVLSFRTNIFLKIGVKKIIMLIMLMMMMLMMMSNCCQILKHSFR